jgi:hypothetical protein
MAAAGFLSAQSADEVERMLHAPSVTYSEAVRFVYAAANVTPAGGLALEAARGDADGPASLGDVAFLIMRAFDLEGGILYRLFPGPRYACRELVYWRVIQGRTDPGGRPDGRAFLQILGRALTYTGGGESDE